MKNLVHFFMILSLYEDVFCILSPCDFFRKSQPIFENKITQIPARNYGLPTPKPNYGAPSTSVKPDVEELTTPQNSQYNNFLSHQKLPYQFKNKLFKEIPKIQQSLPFKNPVSFSSPNVEFQKSISVSVTHQQLPVSRNDKLNFSNNKRGEGKRKIVNNNVRKSTKFTDEVKMMNVPTSSTFIGRLFLLRNDGNLEPVILRRIIPKNKDSTQNENVSAAEITQPFHR